MSKEIQQSMHLSGLISKKFKQRQRIHRRKSSNYRKCKINKTSFIKQRNLNEIKSCFNEFCNGGIYNNKNEYEKEMDKIINDYRVRQCNINHQIKRKKRKKMANILQDSKNSNDNKNSSDNINNISKNSNNTRNRNEKNSDKESENNGIKKRKKKITKKIPQKRKMKRVIETNIKKNNNISKKRDGKQNGTRISKESNKTDKTDKNEKNRKRYSVSKETSKQIKQRKRMDMKYIRQRIQWANSMTVRPRRSNKETPRSKLQRLLYGTRDRDRDSNTNVYYSYLNEKKISLLEHILCEYIYVPGIVKMIVYDYCDIKCQDWSNTDKSDNIRIIRSCISAKNGYIPMSCAILKSDWDYDHHTGWWYYNHTGYNTVLLDNRIHLTDVQDGYGAGNCKLVYRFLFKVFCKRDNSFWYNHDMCNQLSIGFATEKYDIGNSNSKGGSGIGIGNDKEGHSMCGWFKNESIRAHCGGKCLKRMPILNVNEKSNYILYEINFIENKMKFSFNVLSSLTNTFEVDIPNELLQECVKGSVRIGVTMKTSEGVRMAVGILRL